MERKYNIEFVKVELTLCWIYLKLSKIETHHNLLHFYVNFENSLVNVFVHISVGSVKARADSPDLQRCFFQLSGLGMDPIIMLGGFSAFNALYPFLCTTRMVLIEPERHTLTIYPSEILEDALYQGSVSQASDYRIIKNLQITHVVNATANCPDAFPNTLCYLRLRLSDDSQQDLVEALPLASRFINTALRAVPAGRVLVHCSMGRSRSSALTLAFLMQHRCWSLLHAVRWLKEKRACTAPNVNFLRQLLTYEEQLFGRRLTSLDDIRRWLDYRTRSGIKVTMSGSVHYFLQVTLREM